MKTFSHIIFFILISLFVDSTESIAVQVITKENTTFIIDRTGEMWDITQAVSIGFLPHKFQYGIGKNAFTPLQNKDFVTKEFYSPSNLRIIGLSGEKEAHAYAINLLRFHEIANTTIDEQAVAVGY